MKLASSVGICALLLPLLVAACEEDSRSCTLMGCDPPLTIVLAGAGGEALPLSTYEIALVIDGQPGSLACGNAPEAGGWFCEPPEGFAGFEVKASVDEGGPVAIRITVVRHDGADELGPDAVEIDVIAGDAPLVDTRIEPEYTSFEPNGEGCGVCDEPMVETIEIAISE